MPHAATLETDARAARARLRWRCRRGMRELDVLLLRYLDNEYPQAEPAQRRGFERLLELQDPVIMALLTGRESADPEIQHVVARLTSHQN
jgi:antitoxin CptB